MYQNVRFGWQNAVMATILETISERLFLPELKGIPNFYTLDCILYLAGDFQGYFMDLWIEKADCLEDVHVWVISVIGGWGERQFSEF